ncbi:hypothetical protein ACFLVP_04355 [Chloroflexota bacterium]
MISTIDFKKIKHKVYSAYFADGLWDILLGLFIMAIPTYPILGVMSLICYIVGYFVVLTIRRRMTYPRIGYAKEPGNGRFPIMHRLVFVMVFILIGFSILRLFIAYSFFGPIGRLTLLWYFQNVIFAGAIAFVAYRYGVKRWYLYALWIFAGFTFGRRLLFPAFGRLENSAWPANFSFYITGGVILLSGVVIFVRFLRNNPKMVMEELNEQTQNGG